MEYTHFKFDCLLQASFGMLIYHMFPVNGNCKKRNKTLIVCCCSVAKLCLFFATPWTVACQSPLFTRGDRKLSPSFLKFVSIESILSSNHLILCFPFSFCLQCFPESGTLPMSVFPIRWSKY